jgi:hypothetical protein
MSTLSTDKDNKQKTLSLEEKWRLLSAGKKTLFIIGFIILSIFGSFIYEKNSFFIEKLLYTVILPFMVISIIFWYRRNKKSPFDSNRLRVYGFITFFTITALWLGYGDMTIDGIRTYGDLRKVNDAIKTSINSLNDDYLELCNGTKNDQAKEKFLEIQQSLNLISENCYKNKNLSYEEQKKAHDFYLWKLNEYKGLKSLLYGKIDCW